MKNRENISVPDDSIVAWARLLRASQQLLSGVEKALKAQGLPPLSWYDVLLELDREKGGLRPYQIQQRVLLEQYNVSRLLVRIEADGYVERSTADEDGRGQLVAITKSGKALVREMWPIYRAYIAEHFATKLSASEAKTLGALLAKLLQAND